LQRWRGGIQVPQPKVNSEIVPLFGANTITVAVFAPV